jgi:hypothetical protein
MHLTELCYQPPPLPPANNSWFTASLDDYSEVKGQVAYSSGGVVRVR